MAVYTNINRSGKKGANRPTRTFPAKKLGIIVLIIAAIGSISLFTNFLVFLRTFLMGTFGVFSYVIFSSLFILAKTLMSGKKYNIEKKYAIYTLIAILSFLSILQMAFLGAGTAVTFFEYLKNVYDLQTSVGGVVIGVITYPLLQLLNPVGAYIFYIILLTVMCAFIIDYFYENNSFKKSKRMYVNFNKMNESNSNNESTGFDTKKEKKSFFHKKQPVELSLNTEKNTNTAFNAGYFESVKNNRFEEEEKPNLSKTFTEKPFTPIFETRENNRPPKILHTEYSEGFSNVRNKEIRTDDETRRKNLEFLHSTIPTNKRNEQSSIMGTNIKNPNAEFSSRALNQKINESKPIFNKETEKGIDDIDAKFAADLKMVENNEAPVINKEYNNIFTSQKNTDFVKPYENKPFIQNNINEPKRPTHNFEQIELREVKKEEKENSIKSIYKKPSRYVRPPIDLLSTISTSIEDYNDEYLEKSRQLEQALNDFKVPAKVIAVTRGPAVTRYELQMPAGVSVKKIAQHAEDIAMTLASNGAVRIEAPIPGRNAVGVEVPNNKIATIGLKDILESKEFTKNRSPLTFGLGKDIAGSVKVCDLGRMPHLLIAGATGSGKSVCLNSIIVSLLYKSSPEDLRLILVDPKHVEFTVYNGLPHLMLPNVITDVDKAINAFNWAIEEMERRFQIFQSSNVKNLTEYNALLEVVDGIKPKMPIIVIIVDELADLMLMNKRDVEDKIMRLAAKARAAGIHLILATQRPSVDVITGTIKANLPSRIAFSVTSFADSKTVLDGGGAEKLLGKGDMLYAPIDYPEPRRIQGAFVSDQEIYSIVEFVKENNKAYFDEKAGEFINKKLSANNTVPGMNGNNEVEMDLLLPQALKLFIENGQASTSMLQRKFAIGYSRAARIVDQMELLKYISPSDGAKPRNVYITMEKFKQIYGEE